MNKLWFKSAASAIEYSSKYMDTKLEINKMVPAEVLYIDKSNEGLRLELRIAMDDSIVDISTLSYDPDAFIKVGDLVVFMPRVFILEMKGSVHAWRGCVIGKLDLSYDLQENGWGISEWYLS